jgi:transcriptional regulator with PAS, ATPase and Fis domain
MTGMVTVRWVGAEPGASLRRLLRRAGVTLAPKAGAAVARLVHGRTLPPVSDDALPWIWLCSAALAAKRAREAAIAGAYATISLADPHAAERLAARVGELAVAVSTPPEAATFVAVSSASRHVLTQLWHAARTSMPVLLTGETGTGKDVAARLLHEWSERRSARFIPINCAAIPDHLIEAELFGYIRGAFSGAVRDYDGQLSAATGGTVFLDEIDDTPPTLQVKLLRVLEDRVVSRLGENVWREVDFRIVAACNRDLVRLIQEGTFGADLYERLAIVEIAMPPLRERLEDLPPLVAHFIARFYGEEDAVRRRGEVKHVSAEALAALADYPWPGNARELRNVIFEALVHKRAGDELLLADLPRRILAGGGPPARGGEIVDRRAIERRIDAGRLNLREELALFERHALEHALGRAGGNASRAAGLLGEVGRGAAADPGSTVRAMMRRLGVRRGMVSG